MATNLTKSTIAERLKQAQAHIAHLEGALQQAHTNNVVSLVTAMHAANLSRRRPLKPEQLDAAVAHALAAIRGE